MRYIDDVEYVLFFLISFRNSFPCLSLPCLAFTFLSRYADRNLPVIIPDGLKGWDKAKWTKEGFLKEHGDSKVSVRKSTEVAYDNEFGGMEKAWMSAEDYVDSTLQLPRQAADEGNIKGNGDGKEGADADGGEGNEDSKYLFGLQLASTLVESKSNPSPLYFEDSTRFAWNSSKRAEFALFFLGPAGSGVSLHEHTNAWNALVYGKKQWVLLPPYSQYGPVSLAMPAWMEEWYDTHTKPYPTGISVVRGPQEGNASATAPATGLPRCSPSAVLSRWQKAMPHLC